METEEMQKLCVHLNEFALPRAVVDFDRQQFVAWNKRFLARTGYSEEEIRALQPDKIIVEGELSFGPPEDAENPTARFFPVAVRVPARNSAVPGHLVRAQGNFGYLMLQDTEPTVSTKFEQGRLVGQEQERVRIVRAFHDEVSSGILGALFKIQMARQRLESAELAEAEPVAEASEMLSEAIEKIDDVLEHKKEGPHTSA
jgi:signal transduction histidine kinase